jgi:hypothetical protein
MDHPFYIYSVPPNLACPLLAFCRHIIYHPWLLKGKHKLFEGSNQNDCFNSTLCSIVTPLEHKQTFADLGMPTKYFGTNSIQKFKMVQLQLPMLHVDVHHHHQSALTLPAFMRTGRCLTSRTDIFGM